MYFYVQPIMCYYLQTNYTLVGTECVGARIGGI